MIEAKKVLGQNFLTDQNKIKTIVDSIPNLAESTIVEVGPGRGAITKLLAAKAKKLIAIEIDEDMIDILNDSIQTYNFTLINKDILEVEWEDILDDGKDIQFVSNLPYYISTKIMFKVAADKRFNSMSVMLQKELVDRIFAKNNTKAFGRLTVSIGSLFNLKQKITVPAGCFTPKPNVDSGFIVLTRKDNDFNEVDYLKFIKAAFSAKRKTFLNSLKNGNFDKLKEVKQYLIDNNINENIRSEEITIKKFINIYNAIKK